MVRFRHIGKELAQICTGYKAAKSKMSSLTAPGWAGPQLTHSMQWMLRGLSCMLWASRIRPLDIANFLWIELLCH